MEQVKKAAQGLVDQGYVLSEDLETVTAQAAQRYDVFRNLAKQS